MTRWSTKTLDELEELYWSEIAPDLRRQNIDPHDPPATEVTRKARGLDYALREHHDRTVGQFLDKRVREPEDDGPEPQGMRAQNTPPDVRERVKAWIGTFQGLGNDFSENTLATKRSRVYAYADAYTTVTDVPMFDDLRDPSEKSDEVDRVRAAAERIDMEYQSEEAKLRLLNEVVEFYDYLEDNNLAAYNPAKNVQRQAGWDREDRDNPALEAEQVGRLYDAADTQPERLLVIALCAWGLRPSEVARLHISQIVLEPEDDDVPRLDFEPGERKNNDNRRSTVSMLYGVDVLRDRIAALEDDHEDWSGYLWPSTSSQSGHRTPDTIANWFKNLAERANVSVDGAVATPKTGRRFWYDAYADAIKTVIERLESAAEEQGSVSASVVHQDYLGEDARRQQRRGEMRKRLSDAFVVKS